MRNIKKNILLFFFNSNKFLLQSVFIKKKRIIKGTHQAFKVKDTDKDNMNKYKSLFFFLVINFMKKYNEHVKKKRSEFKSGFKLIEL